MNIARGAGVTLLGQWAKFVAQALSLVVLARLLEPRDFGLYGMVIAITGITAVIGDFGFSSASIQAKEITEQQRSNLFWINTAIGTTLATLLILLSRPISQFYGHTELWRVVVVLATSSIVSAATTQFLANFTRSMRFSLLAFIDVIPQLIGVVAAIGYAILIEPTVWALVVQQLAIPIASLTIALVKSDWYPRLPSRAPMRSFLTFGLNTFLVQLLNYLTSNIASILLGRSGTPTQVGYYNRADQINKIPSQQLATPLTRVMLPVLARRQDDAEWLQEKLGISLRLISYTVGGILAAISATSYAVVDIILGPQWNDSAIILRILAIGGYFQAIGNVYYWAMLALAKTGMQLRFSIVTRLLMLALMLVAFPHGVTWLATAATAGLVINWLILTIFAVPRTGLSSNLFFRDMILPFSVNALLGAISYRLTFATANLGPWGQLSGTLIVWTLGIGVLILGFPTFRHDLHTLLDAFRRAR